MPWVDRRGADRQLRCVYGRRVVRTSSCRVFPGRGIMSGRVCASQVFAEPGDWRALPISPATGYHTTNRPDSRFGIGSEAR